MRLTTQERELVRNITPLRLAEYADTDDHLPVIHRVDGEDLGWDLICRLRNAAGSSLYDDYASLDAIDATMTDWGKVWPSLTFDTFMDVDHRAGHLLWLAGRYQRRFGMA